IQITPRALSRYNPAGYSYINTINITLHTDSDPYLVAPIVSRSSIILSSITAQPDLRGNTGAATGLAPSINLAARGEIHVSNNLNAGATDTAGAVILTSLNGSINLFGNAINTVGGLRGGDVLLSAPFGLVNLNNAASTGGQAISTSGDLRSGDVQLIGGGILIGGKINASATGVAGHVTAGIFGGNLGFSGQDIDGRIIDTSSLRSNAGDIDIIYGLVAGGTTRGLTIPFCFFCSNATVYAGASLGNGGNIHMIMMEG